MFDKSFHEWLCLMEIGIADVLLRDFPGIQLEVYNNEFMEMWHDGIFVIASRSSLDGGFWNVIWRYSSPKIKSSFYSKRFNFRCDMDNFVIDLLSGQKFTDDSLLI